MSTEPRNLHQRLLAIVEDAGALGKDGQTSYGERYKYHRIDDVVDHLRPLLVKHGVILLASVNHGGLSEAGTTSKGNTQWRAETMVDLTFVNADNPEDRHSVLSWGEGIDSSDKSVGKAISYALKNALLAIFWLRGQPDNEEEHHEGSRSKPRQKPQEAATPPPAPSPRASAAPPVDLAAQKRQTRGKLLKSATLDGGWDNNDATVREHMRHCLDEYGDAPFDLNDDEFDELILWIRKGGPKGDWPEGYVPLKERRIAQDLERAMPDTNIDEEAPY